MFRLAFRIGLVSGQTLEYEGKVTFGSSEQAQKMLDGIGLTIDKQLTTSAKGQIELLTANNGIAAIPNDKITFIERWIREYPAGLMRPDLAKDLGKDEV